jgi:acyl-CoA dehydrogenase
MYVMGTLLRHGSDEQKQRWLPQIASGRLRLQAFGVTEPDVGLDTTSIRTRATRTDDGWVVNGQRVWTSRALQSDLMILLARTTPRDEVAKKTEGLSVFLVDMRDRGAHLRITPIRTMMKHSTTEVFFDDLTLPADAPVGEEGQGFKYILTSVNAERMLIASECVGDGWFLIDRATAYASRVWCSAGRSVPTRECSFRWPAPTWRSTRQISCWKAVWLYEQNLPCGAESNIAKFLASKALFAAANAAIDTHGGFGFAEEYDIERKFRETRLYQVAPVSNNLVQAFVGQHVLGLPRSY